MKKVTYIDTHDYDGLTYADYLEYCEEEGCTADEEDSNEFYEWLSRETEVNVECFFENLKYSKVGNKPCVISGELGLWDGTHTIKSVMEKNVESAIKRCWSDCPDILVELEDGVLYVDALHHDGRNCFEIRMLTDKGVELMENDEDIDLEKDTEKFPNYLY